MSVVINENLKLHESIYDVIKKEPVHCVKSPRYKSIHSERIRCERKRAQDGHRTMGYAKYPLRSPCEFLKKKTGLVWVRKHDPCEKLPKPKLKPPLPSAAIRRYSNEKKKEGIVDSCNLETQHKKMHLLEGETDSGDLKICQSCNLNSDHCLCCPEPDNPEDDKSISSLRQSKSRKKNNVILRNILNVVHAKPKTPVPRYVTTKDGTKRDVIPSGTVPRYIYHKNFGKTPKYILNFINEKEAEKQKDQDDELLQNQPVCRYVTQDERDKLLKGLKKNWEEMQQKYQGLPILTDTIPKMVKKAQMDQQLLELEKDIRLVEQHHYIYVYDD